MTTQDVINATKSTKVEDVVNLILTAVCENRKFTEEEQIALNDCIQKFNRVPFQLFRKFCTPFLELNILSVDFSVIPEAWWRLIFMSLAI
ncbi:MAG: hypothetical protein LBF97_03685 [Elusimicrobiota bacterium]|jgi:hypothetical protein|nr:hypothetical protein [Elusimicrobiota bacterium]